MFKLRYNFPILQLYLWEIVGVCFYVVSEIDTKSVQMAEIVYTSRWRLEKKTSGEIIKTRGNIENTPCVYLFCSKYQETFSFSAIIFLCLQILTWHDISDWNAKIVFNNE